MALIVEDGSIVTDAESYISVADADTYLAKYGKDAVWSTKTVEQKEVLLRSSRLYMDTKYSWKGSQATQGHTTNWPRSEVYIENTLLGSAFIPADISNSNALLAAESTSNDLYRNVDGGTSGQLISGTKDAVGPLMSEVSYFASPSYSGTQIRFSEVDAILKPYTIGTKKLQRS